MTDQFGETLGLAMFYMYFVAFAGSMGVLTTVWIGYKIYNRKTVKKEPRGRKGAMRQHGHV